MIAWGRLSRRPDNADNQKRHPATDPEELDRGEQICLIDDLMHERTCRLRRAESLRLKRSGCLLIAW